MERLIQLRNEARQRGNPILRDKSFELLIETVKKYKPKKLLEVGVNVGLSGIAMLLCQPTASLTGIEINEDCVKEAQKNYLEFGVEKRAKIFQGDASQIIPLLTGKYDLIFLDGPKGHYYEYAPNLFSALNKGGILFADNVLFRGYVEGLVETPRKKVTIKKNLEKFLQYIQNTKGLNTQLYHIEDGVSITQKEYE